MGTTPHHCSPSTHQGKMLLLQHAVCVMSKHPWLAVKTTCQTLQGAVTAPATKQHPRSLTKAGGQRSALALPQPSTANCNRTSKPPGRAASALATASRCQHYTSLHMHRPVAYILSLPSQPPVLAALCCAVLTACSSRLHGIPELTSCRCSRRHCRSACNEHAYNSASVSGLAACKTARHRRSQHVIAETTPRHKAAGASAQQLGWLAPTLQAHLAPHWQLSPHWQLPPAEAPQVLQHACTRTSQQGTHHITCFLFSWPRRIL